MSGKLSIDNDEGMEAIRADFPILKQIVHGRPLVYLDNAATTQLPQTVPDALMRHYATQNGNVHRGTHYLSQRSTEALEQARRRVAAHIGAREEEVIFTAGTTAGINALAACWQPEDARCNAIVVTALEHHANFVPWQQRCRHEGWEFLVCPLDRQGNVDFAAMESLLANHRVGLVACAQVSNVLGTVTDVAAMAQLVHGFGALLLVDAAQSIRHERVDVAQMGCDFLAFSGHKMMAPTGIGVLWGRFNHLAKLSPFMFGGEMVDEVRAAETTYADIPLRFEAGTPNYSGAIALGEAFSYLDGLGYDAIGRREHWLLAHAEQQLSRIGGLHIVGAPRHRAGCLSFVLDGIHPFDAATLLDALGFAVRSGNMCAQPLLNETYDHRFVLRVSPAFYNTFKEIDAFVAALERVVSMLAVKHD